MAGEPNGSSPIAPRLLLVGGAPASGKTQLARQLAARYGAALCTKDEIKEILFETLAAPAEYAQCGGDTLSVGWSRRLSDASFALQFHFAATLLRAQRCVLLEGNFRPGEHEVPLTALLSAAGAQAIQILCQASSATRAARLAARAGDAGRHPAHHDERINAHQPGPDFLDLPGARLNCSSDADSPQALAVLCAELDALL